LAAAIRISIPSPSTSVACTLLPAMRIDAEGRWVWGINDFDEAPRTPYPFELVRLVTSARLAPGIDLDKRDAAKAVFEGYRAGLRLPHPTLLDEQATGLRPYVDLSDKDREKFWQEVEDYPAAPQPRWWRGCEKAFRGSVMVARSQAPGDFALFLEEVG
jgi:hypothetical protein